MVPGINQIIVFIPFDGLHKSFGQADGDVEVIQLLFVGLAHDEIHDVRVINPQNAHIGAAPCSALFDGLRGDIEDTHE